MSRKHPPALNEASVMPEVRPEPARPPAPRSVALPSTPVSRPSQYGRSEPPVLTPWLIAYLAALFLFVMYLVLVVA